MVIGSSHTITQSKVRLIRGEHCNSRLCLGLHAVDRKMAAAVGWFADPIFLGQESYLMRELLGDRLPTFTPEEMLLVKDSSDFYGCNTCRFHV
jgi:hypothetical protein